MADQVTMTVGGKPWQPARAAGPVVVPDLHPAIGGSRGNRFCGPGALAILTGLGTDETAAAIRQVSGKVKVFGVHFHDMMQAAGLLGLRLVPAVVFHERQPALRAWAVQQPPGRYLVNVTGHYVVVRVAGDGQIEVGDNQSVYPRPLAKFLRAGKRVKRAWKVDEKK